MSFQRHYEQVLPCLFHPHCVFWPSERCGATTQAGTRCKRRASPGSLYCPGSHGGLAWSPQSSGYRRGHPLELEHHLKSGAIFTDVYHHAPLVLVELWGEVSDAQLEAVMAGPDGCMDRVLEEILTGG